MILEQLACDPERIQEKFVPKLKQIVENSKGRLKGYFIWPYHRYGGEDLVYENGQRRYPKRLREFNAKPEDKAINLGSVHIVYMIESVAYLNPKTWDQAGSLTNN